MTAIRGIVFDKDGTLFDFKATWGTWTRRLLLDLAEGSDTRAALLGHAIGYDLATGTFTAESPVVAHTPTEIAVDLLPYLPGVSHAGLVAQMNAFSATTTMVEVVPLVPLFDRFRAMGLTLGLATNDAEAPARRHLSGAGIEGHFGFIAGFDSGHGAKPGAGQLAAFARAAGLPADAVAMVGDSLHDLTAGRAAGMRTVAVLTGVAGAEELEVLADVVLPDISHLPGWVEAQSASQSAPRTTF